LWVSQKSPILLQSLQVELWCSPTSDNLPAISHDNFRQFCIFFWLELNGDFDTIFFIVHCRTLLTIKFVARKRRLYKYAWLTFGGSHLEKFAGSHLETNFIVLKILKLNFWVYKVRQCTIKRFVEVCRALHNSSQKIQNCRTLSWLIVSKLSQVGLHHYMFSSLNVLFLFERGILGGSFPAGGPPNLVQTIAHIQLPTLWVSTFYVEQFISFIGGGGHYLGFASPRRTPKFGQNNCFTYNFLHSEFQLSTSSRSKRLFLGPTFRGALWRGASKNNMQTITHRS